MLAQRGYMESSGEREPVRRALWPMTGYDVMKPILSSSGVKRGSWWEAGYSSSSGAGGGRISGKRRRSRAVAKPPITQLSAQDKAHFKRIVQLFTGLGSSPHSRPANHLLHNPPSKKPALASLLLSNTSPCACPPSPSPSPSPPLLPPPLPSPSSLPLSHPNTLHHLDILSALCSPISSSSRSHLVQNNFQESAFFNDLPKSNSLLPSPTSTSTHASPQSTTTYNASPNSTSNSSLGIQLTPNNNDTPSISCSVEALLDLQSNGIQPHDTPKDANCEHPSIGVSCSINDVLNCHVDLKSFANQLHDITKDTHHNLATTISYSGGIDLRGQMGLKSPFESHLNDTSPKDIIQYHEGMVHKEFSSIDMENAEIKAHQQVKELDKHVKDLESFLMKENDKVDNFFSLVSLFLEQNTPQCDVLALS